MDRRHRGVRRRRAGVGRVRRGQDARPLRGGAGGRRIDGDRARDRGLCVQSEDIMARNDVRYDAFRRITGESEPKEPKMNPPRSGDEQRLEAKWPDRRDDRVTRLFVGTYASREGAVSRTEGSVQSWMVDPETGVLVQHSETEIGIEAGYLALTPDRRALVVVDERKTDGRGPVGRPAAVLSLGLADDGLTLSRTARQPALGPFPTYVSLHPRGVAAVVASHGSFEHVERVVRGENGYDVEYTYDDSTVAVYPLAPDGTLQQASDVVVLEGHGVDPHRSAQAGGHPQATAHAHSAQFDPSGEFVIVCDKGTDRILVYRLCEDLTLALTSTFVAPAGSAPRHPAFHPSRPLVFVSDELASTVSSYRFHTDSGTLVHMATVSSLAPYASRSSEPADIQVDPSGRYVVVNNRGQDSLVSFAIADDGTVEYAHSVQLAESVHPGLAARSFRFDVTGRWLFVADRPANAIITLEFDPGSGSMREVSRAAIADPAFVLPC
ncbi:beta-propeller fold lactonase family protein [Demequina capsici]|uniref:Beta-propeller fold lactonase family protein n=1 Tax=Demequina capsici TaxID=3075620 RepID=A0AA96FF28_9MICO|nr:beta-propeller fold lactonase family protein [Demequina sp. PMTSA13]WNM27230.1 beta-propeller fold lactonase family protein [Demequina sp. PMTSA13]